MEMPADAATRRSAPFIWVTWLAKLLEGPECGWALWFRAHHKLRVEQPESPQMPMHRARHDAIVDTVDAELRLRGLPTERELPMKVRFDRDVALFGKADLVATDADRGAIDVFEAKGGRPRGADAYQLFTYMWLMEQTLEEDETWGIGGWLVRPHERQRFDAVPDHFEDALVSGVELLAGSDPLPRVPGRDCTFCPLTKVDCPVRID